MSKYKKKIFDIIQIGNKEDIASKTFDIFIVIMIFINLFVVIFETYDESEPYIGTLKILELITIILFTIEYILRVWTADLLFPDEASVIKSRIKWCCSFYGVIDLLTILPYYLPFVFPAGAVAFRILRVIRIFRLFRINAQYDAFNVITNVLKEKRNQLVSSVCLILILMVASSLCMYDLEHEAQPELFKNAFSGLWWSVSTLLTVGYGDIYPITDLGRIMAIVIAFLGVGMVAIPTGIISAGFVEQYSKLKIIGAVQNKNDDNYITTVIEEDHQWINMKCKDIVFPPRMEPQLIVRDNERIIPGKETILKVNDIVIMNADIYDEEVPNLRK